MNVRTQACRDCGELFPYSEEADRCPRCVAESLGEQEERCYHVNGGEPSVDGWTCDDCGVFFPLGTVVEGERS